MKAAININPVSKNNNTSFTRHLLRHLALGFLKLQKMSAGFNAIQKKPRCFKRRIRHRRLFIGEPSQEMGGVFSIHISDNKTS
ncbi:MAG TPA: hypothetical protein VIE89_02700 [Candidatus Binatia bacterium]